jgi:hypothetical protein
VRYTDRQTDRQLQHKQLAAQTDISINQQTQQNKGDEIKFQNNLIIRTKGTKIKSNPTTDHRTRVLPETCKAELRLFHFCPTFTKLSITKLNGAT